MSTDDYRKGYRDGFEDGKRAPETPSVPEVPRWSPKDWGDPGWTCPRCGMHFDGLSLYYCPRCQGTRMTLSDTGSNARFLTEESYVQWPSK